MKTDEQYMLRALELARHGMGHVSPNPMVGAVIVDDNGIIIGEGYHRRYGGPHAEVNAVRSVRNPELLRRSTMYVTLEPCSHYGKTPPCASLILECGIPRVVVAAGDPNPKVAGRGIAMLREGGVEVTEGVLAEESRRLNARFMTAQTLGRPFITLKWAQSRDGFMDRRRSSESEGAFVFSDELSSREVHRLRSLHDAILVGSGTVLADNPGLDCRKWSGRSPRPVILDRRGRIGGNVRVLSRPNANALIINDYDTLEGLMQRLLREEGISSVLVEGGATVLKSFIDAGLWDAARIEIADVMLGAEGCASAPLVPACPVLSTSCGGNTINFYSHNPLVDVKNL